LARQFLPATHENLPLAKLALRHLAASASMVPIVERVTQSARGGLFGLLDTLTSIHADGQVGVLGIVFATVGSTYQKPGAMVLLDRSGMRHGAISGGCLEPELEARAREVAESRRAAVLDFDTRSDEDVIFGSGTGCRGRIHLLLLPQAPGAPLAQALRRLAEGRESLDLCLVVGGSQAGSGHALLGDERWNWESDGSAGSPSFVKSLRVAGPAERLIVPSPPHLLFLGAGPETMPLSVFTERLGWRITLVEHRGRWLRFAARAAVHRIIELPPDEAVDAWSTSGADAAIAMTHNYALDLQHLAFCARSELSYIGLLGPAARRDALLQELDEDLARRLNGRLHAPVGLGLGGSGPEALALSITAELQKHFVDRARHIPHTASSQETSHDDSARV
jgi:xanthine dehydrogenase accessory factor